MLLEPKIALPQSFSIQIRETHGSTNFLYYTLKMLAILAIVSLSCTDFKK
jgi:hypothetical protein